jgi:hypothetical protein
MLNHVALLNPRSPNSMLSLCHGKLPKVVSALFTTLNPRGGDKICFVNLQELCNIGWNGLKGFVQDCDILDKFLTSNDNGFNDVKAWLAHLKLLNVTT